MKRLPLRHPQMRYVQVVDFLDFLVSGESISWVDTETRVLRKIDEPSAAAPTNDASTIVASELTSDGAAKITFHGGTHNQEYETKISASTSLGQVYIDYLVQGIWIEQ